MTATNPFRSAAEMAAQGTSARPAYLDEQDNPLRDTPAPQRAATAAAQAPPTPSTPASSPAAAAAAKTAAKEKQRKGDRVGSIFH